MPRYSSGIRRRNAKKKDVAPASSTTTPASSSTGTVAFSGTTVSTTNEAPENVIPSELPSAVASWSTARTKLNPRAFEVPSLDGSFVLKDPTRAKNRAKEKIVNAILECGDCFDKQALALQSALVDPRIAELSLTAGFKSEESFVSSHCLTQARHLLAVDTTTNKIKGRPSDDKRSFSESVGAAMVTTPGRERDGIPTSQQQIEFLGINRSLFERSQKKRKSIRLADDEDDELVEWSQVRKKRHWSKVNNVLREKVQEWVKDHSMVQESPNVNDTLLVKDPITGVKRRVRKLLLYIPIRELHNDLVKLASEGIGGLPEARDSLNNVLISDTRLRAILPTELRAATDSHKQMCGCQYCLTARFHQAAYNAFRRNHVRLLLHSCSVPGLSRVMAAQKEERYRTYNNTVFPNDNQPLHPKPRDVLRDVMCPWVHNDLPNWKCVCGICEVCPDYVTPEEEKGTGRDAPTISFQQYVRVTRCTLHGVLAMNAKNCEDCDSAPLEFKKGKVRTRKLLNKFTRAIGTFLKDYYLPSIMQYKFHLPHVIILSKLHCGAMRQVQFETVPYSFKTI